MKGGASLSSGQGDSTPTRGRRLRSQRSVEPVAFGVGSAAGLVSLREIKQTAEEFGPTHPLRIILLGEPDELPRQEYLAKLPGWFRLLRARS